MGIELSLIRTLQLLQSCPNLVMVQAWNIIEFHCVICNSEPRVSSYTVNSHFRWSNPLFLLLLAPLPRPVAALLLIRALFLALVLTHAAMGDLLPLSDCISLSALGCEKRGRRSYFTPVLRRFYSTIMFPTFSHTAPHS